MELHLNTYGLYLHVKDAMFELRKKNERGEVEKHPPIAAHKVTRIFLSPGMALSTDAVALAIKNNIDLIFLESNGNPYGRVWHSRLGSTTKIRKCQLEVSRDERALYWIQTWLGQKLQNQADFLQDLKKHRPHKQEYLEAKAEKILASQSKIQNLTPQRLENIAESIRGWEGTAGRIYFESLSHLLAKEYQFQGRSMRPAKDAFNALLNYAYGILYSHVEKSLIIAGIDPYVGFLHRDDYRQLSMVYDFIEPYRIHAERSVFKLFSAKKVNQSHSDPLAQGLSLNAEGKSLLVTAFNVYFQEQKIKHRRRQVTRAYAMQLDAHQLAQKILNSNT